MGDLVHLRLSKQLKESMNEVVSTGLFANTTEFIRDAIRKSIEEYEQRKAIRGLEMLRGKGRLLTKEEQKKAKAELKHISPLEFFRKYGLN